MRKVRTAKKSKMTLDNLALMIQGEFVGVNKRFGQVDKKIDLVRKDLSEEISGVKNDLGADIAFIKLDLAEVKRDVKEMKENSSELFQKLDKFISMYEAQREEECDGERSHEVRKENRDRCKAKTEEQITLKKVELLELEEKFKRIQSVETLLEQLAIILK